MELRELEYFLAIVREGSLTKAASALHLSQPALTRQLKGLEDELGKKLISRTSRSLSLTEDGMLLRKRAEEIISLAERTQAEIQSDETIPSGDIYICAGETKSLHFLTRAAKRLRDRCPDVRFHISSGDTADVLEELEKGLIDFGILFDRFDFARYEAIEIPYTDTWGVLMRKDSPLAEKERVTAKDLAGLPLIVPRAAVDPMSRPHFVDAIVNRGTIAATYSLLFNASILVQDGLGYALCLNGILNLTGESELCFRPISPEHVVHINIVWKQHQVLSRPARAFLAELRTE